ncbi:MAG: C4-type zinc ribbon domain-containing protein [Bacteroidota bacterium]
METPVSKKLSALQKLQSIDSELDEIKKVRGSLPEEVQDLEDDLAAYETRIEKINNDIKELKEEIKRNKGDIKDHESAIKKYEDQKMEVRNNREFEAITRELENKDLDIQLAKKHIKEKDERIDAKKALIEEVEEKLKARQADLEAKKGELDSIIEESKEKEQKLRKDREKQVKNVDQHLYRGYKRLRDNSRNGLAVVMVERHACGGCFNLVPPQRQVEIKERKKIVICEHCGRILADVIEVVEPEKKRKTTRRRKKKKEEAK